MNVKSTGPATNATNRRFIRRAAAAVLLGASALAALPGCSSRSDGDARTLASGSNVTLTAAQRQHIHLYAVAESRFHKTIETNGTVDYDNDQATSVLAPFSGPVTHLLVSPGDTVRKGDALAAVDSPDFAAAISAYQKALATAQTNRRLADLDQDLLQHNGIAQREAAQAETDARNAEADRDAALQALFALEVPANTITDIQQGKPVAHLEGFIRSPIAGTVVEKLVTPGQLLQAGTTPCFTIANLAHVWVMTQLYGSDVASVRVGDTAGVLAEPDSTPLAGRVDNIPALVDPATRSVMVRVGVDNPDRLLRKQMYVRVLVHARQESAGLLVPVASILRDDENLPFAYLLQADGSFARQHVELRDRVGEQYDIGAGLKAGDQIVDDGSIFIQFMQNQ